MYSLESVIEKIAKYKRLDMLLYGIRSNASVACVSGGFDPLHVGHIDYINGARGCAKRVVVIVNGDEFLMEKKGHVFMPIEERVKIIQALDSVWYAFPYYDGTQNVAGAIQKLKPDFFCNDGDRDSNNNVSSEELACKEVGCKYVYLGNPKIQSSSSLTRR